MVALRVLAFCAILAVSSSIVGCTTQPPGSPTIVEEWETTIDSATVAIGAVDAYRSYVTVDRDFGTEIIAINLDDGSRAWSSALSKISSVQLTGTVLIINQKLGEDWIVSALRARDGRELWSKTFGDKPLLTRIDGSFLTSTVGGVSSGDLDGLEKSRLASVGEGCHLGSAASDPTATFTYLALSCDDEPARFEILDGNLRVVDTREFPGEVYFGSPENIGDFTVFHDDHSDQIVAFVKDKLVFTGTGLGYASVDASGDELFVNPPDEQPFTVDETGQRTVPRSSEVLILDGDGVRSGLTRYALSNARTGKAVSTVLRVTSVITAHAVSNGTARLELVNAGKSRTIRRLGVTTSSPTHTPPQLVTIAATVPTASGDIQIDMETGDHPDLHEGRFFGEDFDSVHGDLVVVQLRSVFDATAILFHDSPSALRDPATTATVAQGSCFVEVESRSAAEKPSADTAASLRIVAQAIAENLLESGCDDD